MLLEMHAFAAIFNWDNNIIDGQIFQVNAGILFVKELYKFLTGTSLNGM